MLSAGSLEGEEAVKSWSKSKEASSVQSSEGMTTPAGGGGTGDMIDGQSGLSALRWSWVVVDYRRIVNKENMMQSVNSSRGALQAQCFRQ